MPSGHDPGCRLRPPPKSGKKKAKPLLAWMFHKQERCAFLSESCPCIAVLTSLSVYSDLWTGLRRVRRGGCIAVNARTAALGRVASHEHVLG